MIIEAILKLIEKDPFRSVTPKTPVRTACEQLADYRAGALPVVADDALVGILSKRDVVARLVAKGLPVDSTDVAAIMTPDPVTITAADSLAHAYQRMLEGSFRHLPVMEGERVIGVISMSDIPAEYRLMVERWNETPHAPGSGD